MSCSKLLTVPQPYLAQFRRFSDPGMAIRSRIRRITRQLIEQGTARLIFDESCNTLRGVLINATQDTFSIHGKPMDSSDSFDPKMPSTSDSIQMQFTIVDGETGESYEIDNVTVQLVDLTNPITNASHLVVNVDHPAIKFQTKEVLIGNRADVVVCQYIDPKLSPSASKKVLIGEMSLKVVIMEKNDTLRRMSESVNVLGSDVIEQTTDFLA